MAHQLIYTGAPQGLQAGRSGNCTVARSRGLREGLILPLEQASTYTHLVLLGQEATVRNPTIHLYRRLLFSGTEYRILSRIVDAGADHTGRSNFLSHHLIFKDEWRGLPSPAAILRYWPGWQDRWDAPPGYIDNLSSDEFKALGQSGELPSAKNPEYLAKGWESTFTTFLQGGDLPADFHWMGTRDAPHPGKRIARLFGAGPEEQAKVLENFPGLISSLDADEAKLLDVIAYALGQRSQAAEQEALGQAQESLDNEYEEIERLAGRIEVVIAGTQANVDGFKEQYESDWHWQYDKPLQLYQNCRADYINPAREVAADHEARRQDAFNRARTDYQAAKDRIASGQLLEPGIAPDHLNTLRTLESAASDCIQKLSDGIQAFEAELNEHNRAEQLHRVKEMEERRKQRRQDAEGIES